MFPFKAERETMEIKPGILYNELFYVSEHFFYCDSKKRGVLIKQTNN